MRSVLKSGVFLALAIALSAAASAQSIGGTVAGVVTDAARKQLAGVAIRLVENETGRVRHGVTNAAGEFTISILPPGEYRLEARRQESASQVPPFRLALNQKLRLEIELVALQRTDSVQVTATLGVLRTEPSALGLVIENHQITGLPLDGRNFFELGLLAAGVVPPAPGSAGSIRGDFAVNINGAREDSNNFLLDGVFNGDPKLNGIGVTPPVDAVREFEVATSTYDASFGRNAGGQFNVVLKSGTNQLHGTAYEFFRNRVFDARNFFAPAAEPSPAYQRHQFGASAGGPIIRNRTFLFADFEGRRLREGVTRVTNVPTAIERLGDFSKSPALAVDPFTGQPFPANAIPRPYISPVGLAIAARFPQPNRSVSQQNYVSSPAQRDRDNHFDVRLDHNLGAADDLAIRYSFADRNLYEPFSGAGFTAIPGYGTNVPRRAQNAAASETHAFTPGLLNEFRLGFNRVSAGSLQEDLGRGMNRDVGLPQLSANPRDTGSSLVRITGYSPIGDEYHNPQHSASTIYQVTDSLTWVRGRHILKSGMDLRRLGQNAYRDELALGYVSFLGMSGNALAELLLGLPSLTGAARVDNQQHLRTHSGNFFMQELWRLRPDLTLTAGLRYEYNSPPVDAADRANVYDPGTRALVPAGSGGMPRSGYQPDRNNWAPRLGVAWRPRQGGSVIRAGLGVYYDQSALATGEGLYFNAPYYDLKLYFSLPQLPLTLADPFPRNFPFALPSTALTFQRDLRTAYTGQWNLGVQHEFGPQRVVELAYAGAKGTKLLGGRDLNQPLPGARQPNPRPVPEFDDINILESRGNSSYHSLQFRLQQNLRNGLSVLAAYTWSKSIDDASGFFTSAGDANFPQDSLHAGAERGLSSFDVRHRFSLSYSYDLPFGKGLLAGGWQTFGSWAFQTGRPFTAALLSDLDNSNTGRSTLGFGANDRPDVARNPALSNPGPGRWFDTSAFTLPPFGTFGNAGRNILTGPGSQNGNVSVLKNTKLGEIFTVQFRAEAFNVLNHANFDLPDIFFGSPSFGKIQSARSSRRIQFGLKFLF
ncbi:MAG: carboxypeptidase regulatory-like domain-containing protein [Acidobacteria bacterium]|nr:carboxypeptidase regulatory-like domain-containing protein [Acidobacteriota bacterium]